MGSSIATISRNVTGQIRTVGDVGIVLMGSLLMAAWCHIHKACPHALLLTAIPMNHAQITKSILNEYLLRHPACFKNTIPYCTCGKRHNYSHSSAQPRAIFLSHLLYTADKILI
ncbi:hypothetical protein GYMLUDRAFT_76248 [Collybiopsis luxurians FD-317 M1]|uniref:Uncharacterized protein n=1 Tax=Collybiopsis luxurians FD-317 M1 TaxID=944289 RepID=A0A0D0CLR4_9AGAR|nr:hypothetical protein GYMLUDRAFT_76248 [Collybiopsis luxurians FD-317 M1]